MHDHYEFWWINYVYAINNERITAYIIASHRFLYISFQHSVGVSDTVDFSMNGAVDNIQPTKPFLVSLIHLQTCELHIDDDNNIRMFFCCWRDIKLSSLMVCVQ